MASSVAILGYWDIRGLAEPVRLLLEHAGVDYEDRRINMTKPSWLEYKTSLGYDFPNLPYYEEPGGVKLTQSNAILRHLGRRYPRVDQDRFLN
jgi:glutathione S-transferase